MTALMCAAEFWHTEIVSLLIELGADIHAKDDDGKTALMSAAESGHTEIVSLLLDLGADIDAKDNRWRNSFNDRCRK
jgi:ankyrin repeat protein